MTRRGTMGAWLLHPVLPWLVLALAMAILVVTWRLELDHRSADAQSRLTMLGQRLERNLEMLVANHEQALIAISEHLVETPDVSLVKWKRFVGRLGLFDRFTGPVAVVYAPLLRADQVDAHEQRMRAQGLAAYRVWPAGPRPLYAPITFVHASFVTNQSALGFDLWTEPVRQLALRDSVRLQRAHLSGPIRPVLMDASHSPIAEMLYVPVRLRSSSTPGDEQVSSQDVAGWCAIVYQIDTLMRSAIDSEIARAGVTVRDISDKFPTQIFSSARPNETFAHWSPDADPTVTHTRVIRLHGREWEIRLTQAQHALMHGEVGQSVLFGVALVAVFLLAGVIWLLQRQGKQAGVARSLGFLQSLIDSLPSPVYVKDDRYRYMLLNKAHVSAFGIGAAELIGRTDRTIHSEEASRAQASQESRAMETGVLQVDAFDDTDANGQRRWWLKTSARIQLPEGGWGVCGVLTDISAQKEAEVAARQSKLFLDSIVDALPQPMYVKSGASRWKLVNEAFCKLMGRSREELTSKSDADYWDVDSVARYQAHDRQALASDQPVTQEDRVCLPDGRSAWLVTSKRGVRVEDEEFIVGVIFDLTQHKQALTDLEHARQFLDAIIDALPHSLVIKDEENRYLLVNQAWCTAVGIDARSVLGRTSRDLFPEAIANRLEAQDAEAWRSGGAVSSIQPRVNLQGKTGWSLKTKTVVTLPNGRRYNVQVTTDVTEQQQALAEIDRSRALLLGVLDSIPNPVHVKNQQHGFILVNAAARALGAPVFLRPGLRDEDVFSPEISKRYAAEDDEALNSDKTCWFMDHRKLTHGGERWWLKSKRAFSVIGEERLVVTLMSDVTSLKETERDLMRSQARLRVLNDISMAILHEPTLAALGRVTCISLGRCFPQYRVSHAVLADSDVLQVLQCENTGQSPSLRGRVVAFPASTPLRAALERHGPYFAQDMVRDSACADWREWLRDDSIAGSMFIPLTIAGHLQAVLWIDRTEEKNWESHEVQIAREVFEYLNIASHHEEADQARVAAEAALRVSESELRRHRDNLQGMVDERTRDLTQAITAAEQANKAKSQFFANMSHELRTPMHSIISFSKLGLERVAAGEATPDLLERYLTRIARSGDRLLALINDVLDLAKMESGRMKYKFVRIDLCEVVEDVFEELAVLAAEKAIHLELQCQAGNAVAECDRLRMEQVIRNVVSNAIRFSPQGGKVGVAVEACLMTPTYATSAGAVEDGLQITVQDEGSGIPEGEFEHIFDKYIQSSSAGRTSTGTGLGLPIAREIISQHGGSIVACNGPQGGAQIIVMVPRSHPMSNDGQEMHASGHVG